MQLKELNVKKTDRGMVITLGDVLFTLTKRSLSGVQKSCKKHWRNGELTGAALQCVVTVNPHRLPTMKLLPAVN